jgi:hypothetical protein
MSAKRLTGTLMAERYSAPYKLNIVCSKSTSGELQMCTTLSAPSSFLETLSCLLIEPPCLWLSKGCRDRCGMWYKLKKYEICKEFCFKTSRIAAKGDNDGDSEIYFMNFKEKFFVTFTLFDHSDVNFG